MNNYDLFQELLTDQQKRMGTYDAIKEAETLLNGGYVTPDYSNFGIMANTPGPTPDGLLIQDFIDKNNW